MRLLPLLLLLAVAACKAQPLPAHLLQANRKVYDQIDQEAFLKHKVLVEEVVYQGDDENMAPAFDNAKIALSDSLAIAGLNGSAKDAQYNLSAAIKDVKMPLCIFGTCKTGSTIDYSLTERTTKRVVLNELVVVPFNYEYNIFAQDAGLAMRDAYAGAVGENFAHMIQVLNKQTETGLGKKP